MFLWGRGGVSTGAVRAVAAVTLAVQAESEGGGTRQRSEVSFTQTQHVGSHCEEVLTGRGATRIIETPCFWPPSFISNIVLNWWAVSQK